MNGKKARKKKEERTGFIYELDFEKRKEERKFFETGDTFFF